MSSKGADVLDFGYDAMGEELLVAYGKLPGTEVDIVSAFLKRTKEVHEVIFTVTDISLDAEKIPVTSEKSTEPSKVLSADRIDTIRTGILIEFLNKVVLNILLNESGGSRLVFPFVSGMNDTKHRLIKEGINSADKVRVNTASRELIIECE